MEVSVQSGEGLERRITVGLPPDRVEAEVDRRLKELARTARMPGFRPGKVPLRILRQRFGGNVQQEVFGELVQSSFSEAVTQEQLRPAGTPHIEADIDQSENRYGYTAVFEVLPQFELGSLEGKTLKRPVAEVTNEDLDAMLQRLRDQRKTWNAVERPAQNGDLVTASYSGTVDGEAVEGGAAEDAKIELGAGRMIPGFEDGLVGVGPGEERKLELSFPDDYSAEHLQGVEATFDLRVKEISEPVLPELDDEFARSFGIEDGGLERFRKDVRENMERELKERVRARIKAQAMDLLLEVNPIDLPEILIKEEIQALKKQARESAGGGRLELPDGLFEDSARRRVALGLVIAEVVKANNISVDPQRVRDAVVEMASTYEQPQEVIDFYYSDRKHLASVESLALEDQVVDWIMEQAEVEDEPATFKEITKPQQP